MTEKPTVKDLIALLEQVNPEAEVWIESYSEPRITETMAFIEVEFMVGAKFVGPEKDLKKIKTLVLLDV
jgi:hypothetical protein